MSETNVLEGIGAALVSAEQDAPNRMLSRQALIIPENVEDINVFVLGVGGIGSNVIPALARMGVRNFEFWDYDDVEDENVYPSGFSMEDVGMAKVEAIINVLERTIDTSGMEFTPVSARFSPGEMPRSSRYNVVISCPDSMSARRGLWEGMKEAGVRWDLWIDARMGGSTAAVFSVMEHDDRARIVYNDTEIAGNDVQLPCGEKATAMITSGFIPGMISQSVRDYLMGRVPVYWQQYDGDAQSLSKYGV